MQFKLGKLINSAGKEEASNKLQEGPESSAEELGEDIIVHINPASTKDETKLNENVLNGT